MSDVLLTVGVRTTGTTSTGGLSGIVHLAGERDNHPTGWPVGVRVRVRQPEMERVAAPTGSKSPWEFTESVYCAARENEHDAADVVFAVLDALLQAGRFNTCDAILLNFDPHRLPLSTSVSVLIATRRAKNKLPSRPGFHAAALAELVGHRGTDAAAKILNKYL